MTRCWAALIHAGENMLLAGNVGALKTRRHHYRWRHGRVSPRREWRASYAYLQRIGSQPGVHIVARSRR